MCPERTPVQLTGGPGFRTWEWRNQNQFDYLTISTRIWKNWLKWAPAISIAWQPFPNEAQALAGRVNAARPELAGGVKTLSILNAAGEVRVWPFEGRVTSSNLIGRASDF